ncbi:MAG: FAD-binding oxidoreductase, partial [Alphaproteobacteria bacterium]
MSARSYWTLEIAAVRPETAEAIVVGFRRPADPAFAFRPGQYLTLRADIAGVSQERCYSICSAPGDPLIEVAVKRVAGGRFSDWAHATLRPGMAAEVLPPEGRFGALAGVAAGGAGRYLALAAGSGITPILSLARTLLAADPGAEFTLVYGNRSRDAIMFREALDDLKDRYLARFSVVHVLSREASDVELFHGRIDAARL